MLNLSICDFIKESISIEYLRIEVAQCLESGGVLREALL